MRGNRLKNLLNKITYNDKPFSRRYDATPKRFSISEEIDLRIKYIFVLTIYKARTKIHEYIQKMLIIFLIKNYSELIISIERHTTYNAFHKSQFVHWLPCVQYCAGI